ncbi:NUDIX domain-containing protein [Streptomyces sp. NPDC058471]|uniref:NUDIX domain-containing protein n=1 Tax=Streptomyces sp. NPDC058471 TaxID=3346516 RepID=UPI003657EECD
MATTLNLIGSHLLFERNDEVLLGLRGPDAKFAPDTWHFPAGCCEHESVKRCAVREAEEELGLLLAPEHLDLVHTVHLLDPGNPRPLLELIFRVTRWSGEPQLMEPDKCSAWAWWPKDALPQPIVPYAKAALEGIAADRTYTELGWPAARQSSVTATTSKES